MAWDHHPVRQGGSGPLDEIDQALGGGPADAVGVLAVGGEPGGDDVRQRNAVVAHDGDILRDTQAHLPDHIHAADVGIVIGEDHAGGPIRQLHQLLGDLGAALGIVVAALPDQGIVNADAQGLTGPVKAGEPVFRNGGPFAVDEGQLPVTVHIGVADQSLQALDVVGKDTHPVVENMVDGDHRKIRIDQLQHLGVRKIHAGNDHPVYPPVEAVLQIAALAAYVPVDEGHVIALGLGLHLQAFQHGGEVFMGQAAALLVYEQNADVEGPVGFQRPGGGVGHIAHFHSSLVDPFPGLRADIRLIVQGLADGGHRNTAALGDILHGNHGSRLLSLYPCPLLLGEGAARLSAGVEGPPQI